jgi:3-hydroxyisobutyrate dehydrogenase-like beta-hydroxyacid dehydrogenase
MSSPRTPEVIGIVGLGLVGQALAQRLGAAGFSLIGFDRLEAARAAWVAQGRRLAPSAAALGALCQRCVLAVYDTAGVLQVVGGPTGVLSGGSVKALIDCSTGDPDALQALSQRLSERGVDFIEAPLSGSSQQIADGQATLLLGGPPAAVQRHGDLLAAIAHQRLHVGGAGMGAKAKLATNLVLGLNRAALAEGMVFAEALGIEPARFLELVLATPARSDAAQTKGAMMVSGEFSPQSRIRQHLRDVDLMLAQATGAGQRLPLTTTHAALLRAAMAAGDGEMDNAAIIRQMRREAS